MKFCVLLIFQTVEATTSSEHRLCCKCLTLEFGINVNPYEKILDVERTFLMHI